MDAPDCQRISTRRCRIVGREMNVEGIGLDGADIAELRSRGDFADETGLGIADEEVGIAVDCDPEDTGPGQGCSGEVAGAAGTEFRLRSRASVPVGVGLPRCTPLLLRLQGGTWCGRRQHPPAR